MRKKEKEGPEKEGTGDGTVRMKKIIVPEKIQERGVETAPEMVHIGMDLDMALEIDHGMDLEIDPGMDLERDHGMAQGTAQDKDHETDPGTENGMALRKVQDTVEETIKEPEHGTLPETDQDTTQEMDPDVDLKKAFQRDLWNMVEMLRIMYFHRIIAVKMIGEIHRNITGTVIALISKMVIGIPRKDLTKPKITIKPILGGTKMIDKMSILVNGTVINDRRMDADPLLLLTGDVTDPLSGGPDVSS